MGGRLDSNNPHYRLYCMKKMADRRMGMPGISYVYRTLSIPVRPAWCTLSVGIGAGG